MPRSVLVLALLLAGCLIDHTVPCGDLRCPVSAVCMDGMCVRPDQFAACEGRDEDEGCATANIPGICHGGACIPLVCGDGMRVEPEVCDDRDQLSGDGCSADCLSDETCGNGYVDFVVSEQCDDGFVGLSKDGCTSTCTIEVPSWRDVIPVLPLPRVQPSLAFDSARNLTVVFGGVVGGDAAGEYVNETWEWNGATWFARHPANAPGPGPNAIAFDAARAVTVLVGGSSGAETWTWDGYNWEQQSPPVSPPARYSPLLVYDPLRREVVLYGGRRSSDLVFLTDTWAWDGATWTLRATAPAPPTGFPNGAWDATSGRIVLQASSGTWAWDGAAWAQISVTQPAQTPTSALLASAGGGAVMMKAGAFTYELRNGAWTQLASSGPPVEAVSFDAARGRVVGVNPGTSSTETWDWDGISWTQKIDLLRPISPAVAYDPYSGTIVAIDYTQPFTWQWNGTSWTRGAPTPPARSTPALVTARDGVVMYGGYLSGSGYTSETWSWSGAWTKLAPATLPPARSSTGLAYDVARDRIVLFGGQVGTNTLGDTWEFDGSTWNAMTPAHSPPTRGSPAMAYDVKRQRVVMFGGQVGNTLLGDTWEWDGVDWIERTPVVSPAPRAGTALMTYDPQRRRVVLVVAGPGPNFAAETWEWLGDHWQRVPAVVELPPLLGYRALAYDARSAELIVQGYSWSGTSVDMRALRYSSSAVAYETCRGDDQDLDELVGCADPDCWARCMPACLPGESCDPTRPRCGDGACSTLEDTRLCPGDCP